MKTTEEIKADIDTLVRKQGNQGALKLGDILDDIVDIVQSGFQEVQDAFQDVTNTLAKFKAQITDVATFHTAVPSTATEIVFAFLGEVDLTGYTKSGSVGKGIDVYANGTKYAVVSAKIICAPANSANFFRNYASLTTLDFSNFDTAKVITFASMFEGCIALTSLDLSNFDTAKATSFANMFESCDGLTSLDLSNFDTANVETFLGMFIGCRHLTSLDLSNFDTAKATSFVRMFKSCSSLTTIIANDWSASVTSTNMFNGCTSLVGGNGTHYNSNYTDATYARIDAPDNPGYFTAPA